MTDVIVIAGTIDARKIIEELAKLHINIAATVATGFGRELLQAYPRVEIYEGRLDREGMAELIVRTGVRYLVDASHPFAKEASLNAMDACEQAGIAYLRFEREEISTEAPELLRVKDFEEAAEKAASLSGNILLTTGSKHLEPFLKRIPDYRDRLFVRILPESRILAECEKAGLTAKNIIAVKGPFSEAMNLEMLKHCGASVLVTKESGDAGGTGEKLRAAASLGVRVILVERPEIGYTRRVSSVEGVVGFIQQKMSKK